MSANRTVANDESSCTPDMNQTGGCVNCSRPVTFDNFVQCYQCDSWWHMRCAGLTESGAERGWTCDNCLSVSTSSKFTNKSARIALRLQKLEEERVIQLRALEAEKRAIEQEKKLMQEKYFLLEEQLEKDYASNRSRVSRCANMQNVSLWVNYHSSEGAVGGAAVVETTTVESITVGAPAERPSNVGASSSMEQSAHNKTMEQTSAQHGHKMNPPADRSILKGNQQQNSGATPKTGPKVPERIIDGHVRPLQGIRTPCAPLVMPPGKPPPLSIAYKKNFAQPRNYYRDMLAKLGSLSLPDPAGLVKSVWIEPVIQGHHASSVTLPPCLRTNQIHLAQTVADNPNVTNSQPRVPSTIPATSIPHSMPTTRVSLTHIGQPEENEEDDQLCCLCEESGRPVRECDNSIALSIDDRWKTVQTNDRCRSCLNAHVRRSCRCNSQCGINGCTFRHHYLLHSNHRNQPSLGKAVPNNESAGTHTHRLPDQSLLFRIVPVTLHRPKGMVKTYAFLDEGSSLTLIEEELANNLGVDDSAAPLCLTWTGNVSRMEVDSKKLDLAVSSSADGKRLNLKNVRTVKKLALPMQTLPINDLEHKFPHLRGLPIPGYDKAIPRLLIGVNNLRPTIPLTVNEGHINEPVAIKTWRGWCTFGGSGEPSPHMLNFHAGECDGDLHEPLKECNMLGDVNAKPLTELLSVDIQCVRLVLDQTTVHIDDGVMAIRRLESYLERKTKKSLTSKDNFHRQIREYQQKGCGNRVIKEKLKAADLKRVAVFQAQLMSSVLESHAVAATERVLWMDSTKGLVRLGADPRRYKQYIVCGIDQLLEQANANEWWWIPLKQNPTYYGTKCESCSSIEAGRVWCQNPSFVQQSEWPTRMIPQQVFEKELRACNVLVEATMHQNIGNLKRKIFDKMKSTAYLTQKELWQAEETLVEMVQRQYYPGEIAVLSHDRDGAEQEGLYKRSVLYPLKPFEDEGLHVDERIRALKHVCTETKFRAIFPKQHWKMLPMLISKIEWFDEETMKAPGNMCLYWRMISSVKGCVMGRSCPETTLPVFNICGKTGTGGQCYGGEDVAAGCTAISWNSVVLPQLNSSEGCKNCGE